MLQIDSTYLCPGCIDMQSTVCSHPASGGAGHEGAGDIFNYHVHKSHLSLSQTINVRWPRRSEGKSHETTYYNESLTFFSFAYLSFLQRYKDLNLYTFCVSFTIWSVCATCPHLYFGTTTMI